jgi:hypothetical protein
MSAKSVRTFADRGCRVVSATDPHDRIFGITESTSILDASKEFILEENSQKNIFTFMSHDQNRQNYNTEIDNRFF